MQFFEHLKTKSFLIVSLCLPTDYYNSMVAILHYRQLTLRALQTFSWTVTSRTIESIQNFHEMFVVTFTTLSVIVLHQVRYRFEFNDIVLGHTNVRVHNNDPQ